MSKYFLINFIHIFIHMAFGTEIKRLREASKASAQLFADAIGISADRLRKWEQRDLDPRYEDAAKIEAYFEMSIQELIKLKKLPKFLIVPDEMSNLTISEPETSYINQRRNQKIESEQYKAPLMPVKAQAGYVRARDQSLYVSSLDKFALPPGVNPQGAIWRYWEIEGDSMEPVFHSKDIILTSQVPQMDWENIRNFYLYVIVTDEKVLFKRIFCKNDLEWVLISENESLHPQQLLPVEYIKEVWVYRRSIVNKAPPSKMFEIKV